MTEREQIVAWLRGQAQICDCFAYEEGECSCGAWREDDEGRTNKMMRVEDIADAIERGDFIKDHPNG